MCEEGLDKDKITFISLLSACSGALVVEGLHYFESMTAVVEDYACSVDLLGCVGQLEQAEDLIKMMPCQPSSSVWKGLLCACRVHGNMEMGLQRKFWKLTLEM
jgi:hypothetical protein